jgi:hypothetical protein
MRTHGTEDDFISLSVTKRDAMPQGPHPESRLMREEDELGEEDDGMLFISSFFFPQHPYKGQSTRSIPALKSALHLARSQKNLRLRSARTLCKR